MGVSILFYIIAAVIVISAVGVISARNPVYSALSLVVTLISVAVLYLLLHAEFLAVVQVLTYAGAILVLFVFIIMLLNLRKEELFEKGMGSFGKFILSFAAVIMFLSFGFISQFPRQTLKVVSPDFGSVAMVGKEIFTSYVLPFEIAGVLLTVALIGAVLLAKKDLSIKGGKND